MSEKNQELKRAWIRIYGEPDPAVNGPPGCNS